MLDKVYLFAEEDERLSAWACLQRFFLSILQWTVDLKTQTEEVNQGLDLDFEDLLVGCVCLSSEE